MICNRNTRLNCGLQVPFSLASVATRTWSFLAGNDLPDCNLRRSITSFQALDHFFYISFEVYLGNDKSFLNCCNQLFCHRIPLVLARSLYNSWWNVFLTVTFFFFTLLFMSSCPRRCSIHKMPCLLSLSVVSFGGWIGGKSRVEAVSQPRKYISFLLSLTD